MRLQVSILVLSALLATVQLKAQQSTYFPHHLGDMWEYFVLDGAGNDTLQITVISDSTDPGGLNHIKHSRHLLNPAEPPWFPWYETFTLDTTLRVFGLDYVFEPPPSLVYRLDASVGQWWVVNYLSGSAALVAKLHSEYPDTVFGRPTTVKAIVYYGAQDTSDTTTWLAHYGEQIAQGLGTIFRGGGDLGYNLYLRGCVIDGILYGDTILVSVHEISPQNTPSTFSLIQNYPNPFNPQTQIGFTLLHQAKVTLAIYDLLGREVIRLIDQENYSNGTHEITWHGNTSSNVGATTGVYLLRLQAGDQLLAKQMLLLR